MGEQDTLTGTRSPSRADEDVTAEGAEHVLCGNVPTANATVYVIDPVLMPAMSTVLRRSLRKDEQTWTT